MRALACLALAACSFERPTDVTFGSAAITITSGDNQEGIAGAPLALPFEVSVVDDDLRPIVNFTVEFTVTDGEGTLSESRVRTDAQGSATTLLTLGRRVGDNTVDVSGEGIATDRIFFSSVGRVGAPGRLVVVAGDGESTVVDTELASPLIARLEDANENPIEGMPVDFAITSGGGSVSLASATSDPGGLVETRITPGTTAGTNTVEARVPGLDPAVFTISGLADAAFSIAKADGDGQVLTALVPADPFGVIVRDQHGNPVAGTPIEWSRTIGTGALSAATTSSDATGRAETVLTATTMIGSNTVEARAAGLQGSPVAFVATTRTLRAPVTIPLNATNSATVPDASVVADIDGDLKPDLVVARGTSPLSTSRFEVVLNRTEPMATTPTFLPAVSFTACSPNDNVTSLSATDVDGDGKLDVVVTAGSKLLIHLNTTVANGPPSFAAPVSFSNGLGSTHYRDHVLADFNGDTKLDALIDVDNSPLQTVLRRSTMVATPSFANDVIIAQMQGPLIARDLDGDQKIDLVGRSFNTLRVCRNTMAACTLTTITFNGSGSFAVIDIDNDDRPDLIAASNGQSVGVARNTTAAALSFAAPVNVALTASVSGIHGADVNGDGKVDLIGISSSQLVVILNTTANGVPSFATVSQFGSSNSAVRAADLNGDQRLDLIDFGSSSSVGVRLQQ